MFIKPLRTLSRSANIISSGNYDQQILLSKQHDEIGDLAGAVNRMAESLKADIVKFKDLDEMKSEFMMIASHNLRTPLAAMSGYVEMAKEINKMDELQSVIDKISISVVRLHELSEDVLTISTIEAGNVMQREVKPLKPFLNALAEEYRPAVEKKGLRWQFVNQVPDATQVSFNEMNMHTALSGLIDNSIKFTKTGGVSVEARIDGDKLIFKVSDSGIGIAPSELNKLFTKFHRGTDIMHYNYEGVGLGLYLSKLIIDRHSGKISIDSQLDKGTVCTVILPLNLTPNAQT